MTVKQLSDGNPDGTKLGQSASDLLGLYGATPVVQRAGAIQATSQLSASSYVSVASNTTAIVMEIAATLIALGIWKGAA
jgi:hypothetical protein